MRLFFTPLILRRITLAIAAFLILISVYFASSVLFGLKVADSALTDNVKGWIWSDGIGWISLNNCDQSACTGSSYGLNIDSVTGDLSGHVWSENIGYISFERTETKNPPFAPYDSGSGPIAHYDSSSGMITGWARALAGCQDSMTGVPATTCASTAAGVASQGWDGWIKLSGVTYTTKFLLGELSGYAWGGPDVVGWLYFGEPPVGAAVPSTDPTIGITANPNLVRSGNTANVVINITSDYPVTCTLNGIGGAPIVFTHAGSTTTPPTIKNYTTSELTSAQEVSTTCAVDGYPALTTTETVRIKVVPILQEI